MFRFFENRKRLFIFAGIGVSLCVLILSASTLSDPGFFANGLSRAATPFQIAATGIMDWFTTLSNNSGLVYSNRVLQLENETLRLENSRLVMQVEETEKLYELLNMQNRYMSLPSIGVRVIGRDPNFATSSFHIDKGSESGVVENMAVFASGGLVGVVRQVHPGRSVVVTLFDSRFAAAGMCVRTGDFGIVRGDLALMADGLIRMDHIDPKSEIEPGDEIVTSLYSSIFPQGLSIGMVKSVYLSRDGLSKYAFILPTADLYDFDMALVITKRFVYD